MKNMQSDVFFSNSLRYLTDCLVKNAFATKHPLKKRYVIVPDHATKEFLHRHMAFESEEKVCLGLHIHTLSEGFHEIVKPLVPKNTFYFPSHIDLSLQIEMKIISLYERMENDPVYDPLLNYIGKGSSTLTGAQRRKIISLAEQLAGLFSRQGLEDQAVLNAWIKKDLWPSRLFLHIFPEGGLWSFPQRLLSSIKPSSMTIHLFGFSYMPKVYVDFFHKMRSTWYVVCPTECFWEDIVSDKERVYIKRQLEGKKARLRQQQQMDLYLKETNPLLGNWGKMGREFVKSLGRHEPVIFEEYAAKESQSLLAQVQNDFLSMSMEQVSTKPTLDHTLSIHACTSILREVEVLHGELLKMLKISLKSHKPILPSDVLILCPRIEEYIPSIHQVFSSSPLPMRILNVEQKNKDDLLHALSLLISLPEKRFEKEAILELFTYTPFQNKQGWSQEDVYQISKWLSKVPILWGFDVEHKEQILGPLVKEGGDVSAAGTWQMGLERLMAGLILAEHDIDPSEISLPYPAYGVEWGDADLLGQLISLVSSLACDMQQISKKVAPLHEWVKTFNEIMAKYFQIDHANPFSLGLSRLCELTCDSSASLSLMSFERVIHFFLKKKKGSYQGGLIEAITFSEMKEGSVLPYRVIALLGMDEERFPRKEPLPALLQGSGVEKGNYQPAREEQDRYLFLLSLLSAQESLLISYCRISREDNKPKGAAAPVEELMAYMKERYALLSDELPHITHPAFPFHESYFHDGDMAITQKMKRAADSYYKRDRAALQPLFPEWYGLSEPVSLPKTDHTISIKMLSSFAKHPIKFFIQEEMGIYLPSLFQKDRPEFSLTGYEKAAIRSKLFNTPLSRIEGACKARGILPVGIFEKIAMGKIKEEKEEIEKGFNRFGLSLGDIFSVQLSETCKAPSFHEGRWLLPALKVIGVHGAVYTLIGHIANVTTKGLVILSDSKVKDLVSIWPLFLTFLAIKGSLGRVDPYLLCTKKEQALDFGIEDPLKLLGLYLDYFACSSQRVSLLHPIFSESLLKGSAEDFSKKMHSPSLVDITPFPDDYMRWVFMRDAPVGPEGFRQAMDLISPDVFSPILSPKEVL